MIGRLKGVAEENDSNSVLLDVCGVGYVVHCSKSTKDRVLELKNEVTVLIEMQTKEDGSTLFGFFSEVERQCFRYLNSVQGVGGKMALLILSNLAIGSVVGAIKSRNCDIFQSISGIGPKLATRIVNELNNSKNFMNCDYFINLKSGDGNADSGYGADSSGEFAVRGDESIVADAISAVINLGFNKLLSWWVVYTDR